MKKYVKRHAESCVEACRKSFKVVLLTGARQTGKSTLLKENYPHLNVISFDDPFLEDQAKENPGLFISLNPPPVIYDEVQYVKDLFRFIKLACDQNNTYGQFILTGSQAFALMEKASESLAGRVSIVELSTLSWREISGSSDIAPFIPTMDYICKRRLNAKDPGNIWEIIHQGGYPELQNPDLSWQAFFSSYIKTYIERDVRSVLTVQNLDDFRRFMTACAARTGQLLNYSNIASEVGVDAKTVKRWLSILEASGIIYLLEPYASSVLKRAIKTPKLYFRDTGLAAYLTRWLTADTLANGAMSGSMFETFVISEILKSYANVGLDYRYFVSYYRGKDKIGAEPDARTESEIDLIIEKDGILYPVEIKKGRSYTADSTRTFRILDKIPEKNRGTGAIICTCPQPGYLRENILQIPVWYV